MSFARSDYILVPDERMSDCLMGEDPRKTVIDSNGKCLGRKNLFVMDRLASAKVPGVNLRV